MQSPPIKFDRKIQEPTAITEFRKLAKYVASAVPRSELWKTPIIILLMTS
jgi:hypothetical protein